jgi:hypothetical protein
LHIGLHIAIILHKGNCRASAFFGSFDKAGTALSAHNVQVRTAILLQCAHSNVEGPGLVESNCFIKSTVLTDGLGLMEGNCTAALPAGPNLAKNEKSEKNQWFSCKKMKTIEKSLENKFFGASCRQKPYFSNGFSIFHFFARKPLVFLLFWFFATFGPSGRAGSRHRNPTSARPAGPNPAKNEKMKKPMVFLQKMKKVEKALEK